MVTNRILILVVVTAAVFIDCSAGSPALLGAEVTTEAFAQEVERLLPEEAPYAYHKRLSEGPLHAPLGGSTIRAAQANELELPRLGWKLIWDQHSGPVLAEAVRDFRDYLATSMQVQVGLDGRQSLATHAELQQCIIVGTRRQLAGGGQSLRGPKDYEIVVSPQRLIVCGYDECGAMYGLYNLEARMNLREAAILPAGLRTVRHSLYDVRLVMSWMGWMEWSDRLLAHLAHDGFDGIFASGYANPNGDRTTAETSTEFYARLLFRARGRSRPGCTT
jgi:hypothetical protein